MPETPLVPKVALKCADIRSGAEVLISVANFEVKYAGKVMDSLNKELGFRVITREALEHFWNKCDMGSERGVYIFSIQRRGRGASLPFYVGKADKTTFYTETFNPRNRRAYTAALLEGHGSPEIYLLALKKGKGPIENKAVDDLETLIIWIARHRNIALLNQRKIDTSPANLMRLYGRNQIQGVLNSNAGKPSHIANNFRNMMGMGIK